jgi:predicted nucleic acid-binding protein
VAALFVDTGAFYAVADRSDDHHAEAAGIFQGRGAGDLISTDHVAVETWFLIRARLGRPAALRFWDALGHGVVRIVGVTSADWSRGREIARRWPDQDFTLVDCTSFAVLERLRILEAFSFDAHFRIYRHGPGRKRGFRVLP